MKETLTSLSITKTTELLSKREVSAVEVAREYLTKIEAENKNLNAYLEVFDDVLAQAEIADTRRQKGEEGRLLGIPLAIKDNILIEGRKVEAASKILEGYHATYDATAISKLKKEGAVFVGRTNMDEFAMGGSTENSAYGPTKNPRDTSRVAGGSSGGSAAVVAANLSCGALGSDTGGSVREPASFCGIVGLKPTYGSVSRSGLIAMGSSLDIIGPITKTVEDAELLYNTIKGKDPLDATSLEETFYGATPQFGKRIGVPYHLLEKGLDPEVQNAFGASLKKLAEKGYAVSPIELPNAPYALSVYYIIMPAESSTNLSRFDGVRYGLHKEGKDLLGDYLESRGAGFGPEVRRRIILGTYVLSAGYYDAYYNRAGVVREALRGDYTRAFESVDVIATPTVPTPAFKLGEREDPLSMYLADIFTVTANLTGMPAISVPCGSTASEKPLPIGIQFTAPHGRDSWLFVVGTDIEEK